MTSLRFRPVGRNGLLVEVADARAAQAAYRLVRRLLADGTADLAPPRDVVPAAKTVLLDQVSDVRGWQRALSACASEIDDASRTEGSEASEPGERTVIQVRYDGPDLDLVADLWRCSPEELVRRHVAARYRVSFCGFAPGFAYCTSEPRTPDVPRRDEPRTSVPAGSVGLADEFCGVYPRAMPGGWQLIGTTDAVLFDSKHPAPALLEPGDLVRFEEAR